ncbi:Na/Pi cotransporter family protein [Pseudomonadota bacterium]
MSNSMIRKILLPVIFIILAYGFWVSPDFKEIAAGVAIFLFGMISLEEGFKAFSGGLLENLLRRTTNNLWKSLSFGTIATTFMQSSSLVSVLTISFLSAGLIDLAAGIGIIFGANIGTTTGAWLVAGLGLKVKISAYAMPMLVFGVILIFQKTQTLKGIGYVLTGLGFLFLGIHYMKEGFEAFKETIDLEAYAVPGFAGLLIFGLIGIAATVIMQSSHATLVLIITALAAQQVTYENALALAIGANVGTTITAIIGAMSANVEGKRLAAAHFIFNVVTGLVAMIFIQQLIHAVDQMSSAAGITADNYALKLAVFHTLFNLLGVLLMIPFIKPLVSFLNRAFKAPSVYLAHPIYLNDAVMEFPETVLEAVRKETFHLYDNAFEVMAQGLNLSPEAILSDQDIDVLAHNREKTTPFDIDAQYERKVKVIHSAIVAFISRANVSMPSTYTEQLYRLREASQSIVEAVKGTKHLQKNLSHYSVSNNLKIRREYNDIRAQLGGILRKLNKIRHAENGSGTMLSIDVIKVDLAKRNAYLNGILDGLIRKNHISAEMATSLMNDSGYADDVAHKLINIGSALFSEHNPDMNNAERTLALDTDDIEEIVKSDSD